MQGWGGLHSVISASAVSVYFETEGMFRLLQLTFTEAGIINKHNNTNTTTCATYCLTDFRNCHMTVE